jgi:2-polyprenyl-6-methoxyphenol hydroxylase and related FAD-dependent oxidoreductases
MKVIIGGAGITGLAVGYYLQQKRIDFEIYEESHYPSFSTTGIQLASNCHFVFKELGIYDQIKEASIEKKTLKVYSENYYLNELSITNNDDEGTFFIRRSDLLSALSSLIPSERMQSSKKIFDISSTSSGISLNVDNHEVKADLFIDCMGAIHS